MKNELRKDAKVVLTTALAMTLTLWIKRTVDRLSTMRWVDQSILHGNGSPSSAASSSSTNTSRFGPGSVYVPGHGRVYYRAALKTSDGHLLYDHSEALNPTHIGPCPLLRRDTDCEECVWFIDDGPYHYEPKCAALVKLEDSPREFSMSLSDTKRALEHSI